MLEFRDTTATKKVFALRKRIRAVSGGTGASKTISILIWLIDYCQSTRGKTITVVAESFPHLQLGAIRDFRAILQGCNYWKDERWNDSKHLYTFETSSYIEFISFDKFGKAHGPRRDVLFINEANNIPYDIADQLMTRTREIVWLDWNPSEEFWYYMNIKGQREDVDFLKLTYLDNEALDEVSRNEIESHRYNKEWWTVYGEGNLGVITTRIYKDWKIIEAIPHEARLERYGLDFGYTNDPTAIVAVYYYNGGWILDERCYKKGMSNKEIADTLKAMKEKLIVADSAEPKSIDELRQHGLNVQACTKGKDSVRTGIQFVQDQPISVTATSVNLIKEYRNYLWITDKNGKVLNEPEKGNDHLCFVGDTIVDDKRMDEIGIRTGIKDVYEYEFSGEKLKSTPEHPILTQRGFVAIDTLRYDDIVWHKKKSLFIGVSGGIGILTVLGALTEFITIVVERILEARGRDYTDSFGKKRMGDLSLMDSIFIILTETPLITRFTISALFTGVNTLLNIGLKKGVNGLGEILRKPLKLLQNGQKHQLANSLEQKWENKMPSIYHTGALQENVIYVEKNTKQWKTAEIGFATPTAVKKHYAGREPVYSLKTKSGMYTANGILVSNCDALRYALSTLAPLSHPVSYWDKVWADELNVSRRKPHINYER